MCTSGPAHLYLLVGGSSRRFGSDKALVQVDGVTMAQGIIGSLSIGAATLVARTTNAYPQLACRTITDHPAGTGPIGGLNAALHDRLATQGPGWLTLASCDLVRPKRQWVEHLESAAHGSTRAVAFRGKHWEPMLAQYHTDLIPVVEQQLLVDRRSMQALLETASATAVPLPDGLSSLPQANTPQQLREALNQRGAA